MTLSLAGVGVSAALAPAFPAKNFATSHRRSTLPLATENALRSGDSYYNGVRGASLIGFAAGTSAGNTIGDLGEAELHLPSLNTEAMIDTLHAGTDKLKHLQEQLSSADFSQPPPLLIVSDLSELSQLESQLKASGKKILDRLDNFDLLAPSARLPGPVKMESIPEFEAADSISQAVASMEAFETEPVERFEAGASSGVVVSDVLDVPEIPDLTTPVFADPTELPHMSDLSLTQFIADWTSTTANFKAPAAEYANYATSDYAAFEAQDFEASPLPCTDPSTDLDLDSFAVIDSVNEAREHALRVISEASATGSSLDDAPSVEPTGVVDLMSLDSSALLSSIEESRHQAHQVLSEATRLSEAHAWKSPFSGLGPQPAMASEYAEYVSSTDFSALTPPPVPAANLDLSSMLSSVEEAQQQVLRLVSEVQGSEVTRFGAEVIRDGGQALGSLLEGAIGPEAFHDGGVALNAIMETFANNDLDVATSLACGAAGAALVGAFATSENPVGAGLRIIGTPVDLLVRFSFDLSFALIFGLIRTVVGACVGAIFGVVVGPSGVLAFAGDAASQGLIHVKAISAKQSEPDEQPAARPEPPYAVAQTQNAQPMPQFKAVVQPTKAYDQPTKAPPFTTAGAPTKAYVQPTRAPPFKTVIRPPKAYVQPTKAYATSGELQGVEIEAI